MQFRLCRLRPGDEALLDRVAPDVFDEPVRPDRLRSYLASPGHLMILALDGDLVVGQCAGVIHAHPDKATELYVDEVGTATSHLRQGVATAMMGELFAWGRELGCEEAWLGTELDNAAANGLYQAFGGGAITMRYYEFDLMSSVTRST
jgi:ribosomal protein S18 acetylase RimI-like enzyme